MWGVTVGPAAGTEALPTWLPRGFGRSPFRENVAMPSPASGIGLGVGTVGGLADGTRGAIVFVFLSFGVVSVGCGLGGYVGLSGANLGPSVRSLPGRE